MREGRGTREVPYAAADFRAWGEEDAPAIRMGRTPTRIAEALGEAP